MSTYVRNTFKYAVFAFVFLVAFFVVHLRVFAQDSGFVFLTGIPGVEQNGNVSFSQFLNALFVLVVGLATLFAVIRIAVAGIQYMFSEVISTKQSAKNALLGAVLGLIIILGTTVALATINPGIVELNIIDERLQVQTGVDRTNDFSRNEFTLGDVKEFDTSQASARIALETATRTCVQSGGSIVTETRNNIVLARCRTPVR